MSTKHEAELNLKRLEANAVWLTPAFAFKFDYSSDEDFDKLAKLAFKAARGIIKEAESLLNEARAKDAVETLKEQQAEAVKREEEAARAAKFAADHPAPVIPKPEPDSPSTPAVGGMD